MGAALLTQPDNAYKVLKKKVMNVVSSLNTYCKELKLI